MILESQLILNTTVLQRRSLYVDIGTFPAHWPSVFDNLFIYIGVISPKCVLLVKIYVFLGNW